MQPRPAGGPCHPWHARRRSHLQDWQYLQYWQYWQCLQRSLLACSAAQMIRRTGRDKAKHRGGMSQAVEAQRAGQTRGGIQYTCTRPKKAGRGGAVRTANTDSGIYTFSRLRYLHRNALRCGTRRGMRVGTYRTLIHLNRETPLCALTYFQVRSGSASEFGCNHARFRTYRFYALYGENIIKNHNVHKSHKLCFE